MEIPRSSWWVTISSVLCASPPSSASPPSITQACSCLPLAFCPAQRSTVTSWRLRCKLKTEPHLQGLLASRLVLWDLAGTWILISVWCFLCIFIKICHTLCFNHGPTNSFQTLNSMSTPTLCFSLSVSLSPKKPKQRKNQKKKKANKTKQNNLQSGTLWCGQRPLLLYLQQSLFCIDQSLWAQGPPWCGWYIQWDSSGETKFSFALVVTWRELGICVHFSEHIWHRALHVICMLP